MEAGAIDNGKPGARLYYDPRYHAANVFDPDGYSLEAVDWLTVIAALHSQRRAFGQTILPKARFQSASGFSRRSFLLLLVSCFPGTAEPSRSLAVLDLYPKLWSSGPGRLLA